MDIDTARAAARDCEALLRNRLKEVEPGDRAGWLERCMADFQGRVNDLATAFPPAPKRAGRKATV